MSFLSNLLFIYMCSFIMTYVLNVCCFISLFWMIIYCAFSPCVVQQEKKMDDHVQKKLFIHFICPRSVHYSEVKNKITN